eukprot:258185-Pyramimonas_sp.AAC.1
MQPPSSSTPEKTSTSTRPRSGRSANAAGTAASTGSSVVASWPLHRQHSTPDPLRRTNVQSLQKSLAGTR